MIRLKYSWLITLVLALLVSCKKDDKLETVPKVLLNKGSADFSKYVAVGASFTAGFSDGALFKKGQENSFPNILSKKFKMTKGAEKSTFKQALMNDNIGGLLLTGHKISISKTRLYLDPKTKKPARLKSDPTTEVTEKVSGGPFNNLGIIGLKSFHLLATGYGNIAEITSGKVNPYFARMSSNAATTVLQEATKQKPTFFTLSEIGGNDVLSYATSGGIGKYQKGNMDTKTYGKNDITDPTVFENVFKKAVNELTVNKAKGALTTVPSIENLPFFTTVPYNSVRLTKEEAEKLNTELEPIIKALNGLGQGDRLAKLKEGDNPILILDRSLTNLSFQIANAIKSGERPEIKDYLIGATYGQSRHATPEDKILLTASGIIGDKKISNGTTILLGITFPLIDKYVLTKDKISSINEATTAYNNTIKSVAKAKNLAIVDFKNILEKATNSGVSFDNFNLSTKFITGGLFSLDGVHPTARGYAFLANKFLEAIDKTYGSNFTKASDGLAKAKDYPINYPKDLK